MDRPLNIRPLLPAVAGLPATVALAFGGHPWLALLAGVVATVATALVRDIDRAGGWHRWREQGVQLAESRDRMRDRRLDRRLARRQRRLEARQRRRRIRSQAR